MSLLTTKSSSLMKLCLCLLVMLQVTACTLVAPYDSETDKGINDLADKTEKFIAMCDAQRTPYSKAGTFYTDAIGAVNALKLRSDLYTKNEQEVQVLERLAVKYDHLRQSHKEGPITSSLAEPIRVSLRALMQMQLVKKSSLAVSKSLKEA